MTFHQGLSRARGDPGFFGALGKLAGRIVGAIPGPIGQIPEVLFPEVFGPAPVIPPFTGPSTVPFGPVQGPGFPAQAGGGGRGSSIPCPVGAECPSGFRKNKSSYFLKNGTFVMPGTRCVKIRRLNPGNGRAVRRAIRRENSFVKLAVGTGLVAVPKAKRVRKAAGKSRR